MSEQRLHITFICSGNICRSPMAAKMFAHQIAERGLDDVVRVSSAGTGGWHAGDSADERTIHVLRRHGYPTDHVIEAALPSLHDWVDDQLADSGIAG